jgi:alkanesulfonate monooxygenase SsuD/methylene tetrahydromethanopterin reductase-like flavin-dependent oxidoreductase (luciferase family)
MMSEPQGRAQHPWVSDGQHRVRFAVYNFISGDWPEVLAYVHRLEAWGFDAYVRGDHPTWNTDCWTIFSALAVSTTRIRLGVLVASIHYRHPVLLARQVADVDRLSGGRLILGVGMGDDEAEYRQLGIPFEPVPQRQRQLEEAVQIVRGVLTNPAFTFSGEFYRVDEARVLPGPVQQPHVPLVIAGGGERVTLRQVAQYADVANFGSHYWTGGARTLEDVRRKLAALHHHCGALGRDPASVLLSHMTLPLVLAETKAALTRKVEASREWYRIPGIAESIVAATPEEAVDYYRELVGCGMRYFFVTVAPPDEETLRLLAEQVMPRLAA